MPQRASGTVHTARVVQRREVGWAGIVTVVLEGVDEPLPDFTAGSHIEVHLPIGRVRQYSLCNAPGQTYQIAVKPEPNGGSVPVRRVGQYPFDCRPGERGPRFEHKYEQGPAPPTPSPALESPAPTAPVSRPLQSSITPREAGPHSGSTAI